MPLVRVEVRNEYGLGAPEMYMEPNNDEPKEIIEGVAVAGLVGLLRLLGDLADFAADVFHDLQEDVTITCSRSYKLMACIQRIEAALVPVEKAVLAQRSHLHFAYIAGVNWHAPARCEKNHFVYSVMPQFILDSYEDCRNPPQFHLLDRFDPGGPGSCLKRYSDPTIFINASETSGDASTQKVSRDMKVQKSKVMKATMNYENTIFAETWAERRSWPRNGDGSRGASFAYHSARMQFPQSNVGGHTSPSQPISTYYAALRSDLYEQSNSEDDICPSYSMQPKEQESRGFISSRQKSHGCDEIKIDLTQEQGVCSSYSYTSGEKTSVIELAMENNDAISCETVDRLDVRTCNQSSRTSGSGGIHLDDFESETDHFMDAHNTIAPESKTDFDCMIDHFSKLEDRAASGRVLDKDEYNSVSLADKSFLSTEMTGNSLIPSSKKSISSSGIGGITLSMNKESISCRVPSNFSDDGSGMPIIGNTKSSHEPEKPVPETSDVTSVAFWTNGGLLGLQPSKPPLCSVLNDLPQCCLSKEDEKSSSSTQHVIFRDRDQWKPDETNSFRNIQEGLDMDSATCQEYQESDESLRKKFWKIIPADADVKLGRSGNFLHPHYVNSTGDSVSESRSFLPVNSEFQAVRNHPETAGSSSSPPLAHMKISVQPMDRFKTSKLKLRFTDGDIINQGNIGIFPTFQLVPEVSSTLMNVDSDSDDDTFSRSSPSLSDDFDIHQSESNSGQRESGGKDPDFYDSLCRISLAESVSTVDLQSVGIQNQSSRKEVIQDSNSKEPLDPGYATAPDPPPLPPVQWWAMKPHLDNTENSCDAMPKASQSAIRIKHSASSSSQQHKPVPTYHDRTLETANEHKSKNIDENNFLNQIRRKSLSLRPTVPAKPTVPAGISTDVQIMTILDKANAIRQAVGSDDGDNWSDS